MAEHAAFVHAWTLASVLLLLSQGGAAALRACQAGPSNTLVATDCVWTAPVAAAGGTLCVAGQGGGPVGLQAPPTATPSIFAAEGLAATPAAGTAAGEAWSVLRAIPAAWAPPRHAPQQQAPAAPAAARCTDPPCCTHAAAAATRLELERLVLVGFAPAPPGGAGPLLWPAGLAASSGGSNDSLVMTDVRLVLDSPEAFKNWLSFFTAEKPAAYFWTVRTQAQQGTWGCGRHGSSSLQAAAAVGAGLVQGFWRVPATAAEAAQQQRQRQLQPRTAASLVCSHAPHPCACRTTLPSCTSTSGPMAAHYCCQSACCCPGRRCAARLARWRSNRACQTCCCPAPTRRCCRRCWRRGASPRARRCCCT